MNNSATANSVQVAEVQLLGTLATQSTARLSIAANADGTLAINSPVAGTLQSTAALPPGGGATQWTDEGPINGSITVNATGNARFYRVVVQQ